jgi:hypothetical protein
MLLPLLLLLIFKKEALERAPVRSHLQHEKGSKKFSSFFFGFSKG